MIQFDCPRSLFLSLHNGKSEQKKLNFINIDLHISQMLRLWDAMGRILVEHNPHYSTLVLAFPGCAKISGNIKLCKGPLPPMEIQTFA